MYENAQTYAEKQRNNIPNPNSRLRGPDEGAGQGDVGAGYVPLRERMLKLADNAEREHGKASRVLDILSRHPEFEEFLMLLDLLDGHYGGR